MSEVSVGDRYGRALWWIGNSLDRKRRKGDYLNCLGRRDHLTREWRGRMGGDAPRKDQERLSALLEASGSVLKYRRFEDAARSIFDSCKKLIGATAGYVALLSRDGTENELLFLDSGGLPCTVEPTLPMPIRGLRAEAYHSAKTVYDNDFPGSEWVRFLPEGHAELHNVLFAPLTIEGKVAGLLDPANKLEELHLRVRGEGAARREGHAAVLRRPASSRASAGSGTWPRPTTRPRF